MNEYLFSAEVYYSRKVTLCPRYDETSLHHHDRAELLYFETGDAELWVEEERWNLLPGTLILIPPDLHHKIHLLSEAPYRRAVLHPQQVPREIAPTLFEKVRLLDISENRRVRSVWERLEDYGKLFPPQQREWLFAGLVQEMLLLLEHTLPQQTPPCYGAFMTKVLAYIEAHITEIGGVDELCERMHVSRAFLYREFAAALHKSPKRYIGEKRLSIARQLLLVGEDATKVAYRCGYRDYSAFYRAYRALYGHSPGQTILSK